MVEDLFWTVTYDINRRLWGYEWVVNTTGPLVISVRGWQRRKSNAHTEAQSAMSRLCDVLTDYCQRRQREQALVKWDNVFLDSFFT